MKKFKGSKKSQLFSRKSYYSALAICLAMVGLACFSSYKQTSDKLVDELSSVTERKPIPSVTRSPYEPAVDAAKNKEGVKKGTTAKETTMPPVTEKEVVHSTAKIETAQEIKKFSIPISGEIIQEFSGDELVKNQTTGAWQTHNGTDISGAAGDEVRAMASGTVTDVLEDPLWGVVVVIDHNDGIVARYCGLNKGLNVEKGNSVSAQDVIGALGNTADIESSLETHLHLEILKNGKYVNPIDVINNR